MNISTIASSVCTAANILLSNDPMTILKENATLGSSGNSAYSWLSLGSLFYAVKKNVVLIGTISVLVCLISMIFVSKADIVAEKKADVMHRLFIIFLAVSAPTLFGWMYTFFSTFLI